MTRTELLKIRGLIEKAAASLADGDAIEAPELFAEWKSGAQYAAGDRVRFGGKLWRCVQPHVSQTDWTPDVTPALWADVAEPGTIPVWRQPTGAQDAYMAGDRVRYPAEDGPVYESTIDYNVYAPDVYGWELTD